MSFLYVALGDSITAGVGTTMFSPGFVQRFRRLAEKELEDRVSLQIFAHSGFKTQDILKEMDNPYIRKYLNAADIITITAGGNDLIQAARKYKSDGNENDFQMALKECNENLLKCLKELYRIKHDTFRPYIIRLINLYNPFPEDQLAVKWINKFTQLLRGLSKEPHVEIVDVEKSFSGHEQEYLSMDHIHPNNRGYEIIAKNLHMLGYGELIYEWEEE